MSLVGGILGLTPAVGIFGVVAVLVLGGLIYQDIVSREAEAG